MKAPQIVLLTEEVNEAIEIVSYEFPTVYVYAPGLVDEIVAVRHGLTTVKVNDNVAL